VHGAMSFDEWLRGQVEAEGYWFQRMELRPSLETPGWSHPASEKLPYFGLPDRLDGMRVLDIGCAEGFFSFEAERRGAREVIGIDSFPDSVRRFNICRAALGSKAIAYLCNVYDLTPKGFGTFDLVMFFGVLYHLRNPLLAFERIHAICTGSLLLQTLSAEVPGSPDVPYARFYPSGMESGPKEKPSFDPTVFWVPNVACVAGMARSAGFVDVEGRADRHVSCVLRARAPRIEPGKAPDQRTAPWS
jgi:tRNA (mo5U34)-methyltransferase